MKPPCTLLHQRMLNCNALVVVHMYRTKECGHGFEAMAFTAMHCNCLQPVFRQAYISIHVHVQHSVTTAAILN